MSNPTDLLISDFDYDLPDDKIARYPLEERDESKLVVFKDGDIKASRYKHIAEHLPAGSLLVFNNTRVVEARLIFTKDSGAQIEVFCFDPADEYADVTTAMAQKGQVLWKCLVGGASKWKHGMILKKTVTVGDEELELSASIADRLSDCFVIKLEWQPAHFSFAEVLHLTGKVPLPPYLHREVEEADKERYQTIYAQHHGSVAAPTAGLHFTSGIMRDLQQKKIATAYVTLHVGAGTFKPVKTESIAEHDMHAEFIDVEAAAIKTLLDNMGGTIVAVGTTSVRTLESLYWLGLKTMNNPEITISDMTVEQWEPYGNPNEHVEPAAALTALLGWMEQHQLPRLITKTRIMIAPGYRLKIVSGLVTNFHQSKSTLLLLIAAFVGKEWKRIYNYALENDFRFLSYGDGCLLWYKT